MLLAETAISSKVKAAKWQSVRSIIPVFWILAVYHISCAWLLLVADVKNFYLTAFHSLGSTERLLALNTLLYTLQ